MRGLLVAMVSMTRSRWVVAPLLAAALASCGSDAEPQAEGRCRAGEPCYVVGSYISTPEGVTTFLFATPTLGAAEEPRYEEDVIAIDEYVPINGLEGSRVFYAGSDQRPELTEWTVSDTGVLQRGRVLSFASLGLSSTGGYGSYIRVVSPTKAYLMVQPNLPIAVWNPTEMTLRGSIDLGLANEGAAEPWGADALFLADDGRLIVTAYWYDWDERRGPGHVHVAEIDTATDAVIAEHDDTRCVVGFYQNQVTADAIYVSSEVVEQAVRAALGEPYGDTPCMISLRNDRTGFDPAFNVDLTTLAGGRPAGELRLVDDDIGYFSVFYAELARPFTGDVGPHVTSPAYRWWRWDRRTGTAAEVPGDAFAAGGLRVPLEGRTYVTQSTADFARTTLVEMTRDGLAPGVSFRGFPSGVVRAR
jgi:hypothetical protein